jgi:hypothetical protein
MDVEFLNGLLIFSAWFQGSSGAAGACILRNSNEMRVALPAAGHWLPICL